MEEKNFVYKFPAGYSWCYVGNGGYTMQGAQQAFWNLAQQTILPELQKEVDQGWEPVSEVGPASISLNDIKKWNYGCLGWFLICCMIIGTWGVGLIFLPFMGRECVEPVKCVIILRKK